DAGSGDGVDEVTSAMLTASRLLVAISARSLAAVEDAVTPAQFRLLVVLASQGPAKLVTLAGLLGVNPSTALRMVDRLAAAGLVDRRASPDSGREVRIQVTPAGRALVDDVTARRRAAIAEIVARMPPDRRRAMGAGLRAFTEAGRAPPVAGPARLRWTRSRPPPRARPGRASPPGALARRRARRVEPRGRRVRTCRVRRLSSTERTAGMRGPRPAAAAACGLALALLVGGCAPMGRQTTDGGVRPVQATGGG